MSDFLHSTLSSIHFHRKNPFMICVQRHLLIKFWKVYDLFFVFNKHLFIGYNCTVFAYGQTGSGKTYTMGTEETTDTVFSDHRGIIPRMLESIFDQIAQHSSPSSFVVSCSMLEVSFNYNFVANCTIWYFKIYEERVIDLLAVSGGKKEALMIRETNKGNVFVSEILYLLII